MVGVLERNFGRCEAERAQQEEAARSERANERSSENNKRTKRAEASALIAIELKNKTGPKCGGWVGGDIGSIGKWHEGGLVARLKGQSDDGIESVLNGGFFCLCFFMGGGGELEEMGGGGLRVWEKGDAFVLSPEFGLCFCFDEAPTFSGSFFWGFFFLFCRLVWQRRFSFFFL